MYGSKSVFLISDVAPQQVYDPMYDNNWFCNIKNHNTQTNHLNEHSSHNGVLHTNQLSNIYGSSFPHQLEDDIKIANADVNIPTLTPRAVSLQTTDGVLMTHHDITTSIRSPLTAGHPAVNDVMVTRSDVTVPTRPPLAVRRPMYATSLQ